MRKTFLILVILLVAAGAVYTQRHALRSLVSGPTPTPVAKATVAPTSVVPTDNIYMSKTDGIKGAYLTDFAGMTLYTSDKDTTGVSTCYNTCAKVWPPYTSGATSQKGFPANISVITRTDGTKQFAWKGMPLYYFATDAKVGDITGNGVGGVWHIVKL